MSGPQLHLQEWKEESQNGMREVIRGSHRINTQITSDTTKWMSN